MTTAPDSLHPSQFGDTIIYDPSQRQYEEISIHSPHLRQYNEMSTLSLRKPQYDETSIHSINKPQFGDMIIPDLNPPLFEEVSTRILPHPQPETIILKVPGFSQESGRKSPLAITLVRNPFVVERRNPFAINLNHNKAFVTKRRPLLSFKRPHLFVGRLKTKNPFALAMFRKKRQSQGLSAEIPVAPRKRRFPRFVKQKRVWQRASKHRVQEGENHVQTQKTMAVADRRRLPRLLLKGQRAKREKQPGDQASEAANKVLRNQKQRSVRKKFFGMSIPSLSRKVKETTTTAEILMVSGARKVDQLSQTLDGQESIQLVPHVQNRNLNQSSSCRIVHPGS
jgi:hypothetical protein